MLSKEALGRDLTSIIRRHMPQVPQAPKTQAEMLVEAHGRGRGTINYHVHRSGGHVGVDIHGGERSSYLRFTVSQARKFIRDLDAVIAACEADNDGA